jgi:hypothetical protein
MMKLGYKHAFIFILLSGLLACSGGGKGPAPPNTAPVANAGVDQSIDTGATATLDASASTDAQSDRLTFQWSLTSSPSGSSASLSSASISAPTFTADIDGTYVFQLVVDDGRANSPADSVSIVAVTLNAAPTANAGIDQTIDTGSEVVISGQTSNDVNDDTITYLWSLTTVPVGSTATISDETAVSPVFTADVDGTYVAQLVVNDGVVDSVADMVTIQASTPNTAPLADSGIDQNVVTGTVVALDGTASGDVDGDPLNYAWTLTTIPAGSSAVLSASTLAQPFFTADILGTYVAELIVNDGAVDSIADMVTILATTPNSLPIADSGINQNVVIGTIVMLDGSGSVDIDGDPLTYAWTLTTIPVGSSALLSASTSPGPFFTADIQGTYVAELIVNDGVVDSVAASVNIVASAVNSAPVANAGANQNSITGSVVTLDGSDSNDSNGDILSYQWALVAIPATSAAVIDNPLLASPSFVADLDGIYIAELTVNDGAVDSAVSSVEITAATENSAPTANAGINQNVLVNTLVNLDGSASADVNGDELTYQWSFSSSPIGNSAELLNDTTATPSFTPNVEGTYITQLLVNDGQESSEAVTVSTIVTIVNSAPIASAGDDLVVTTGTLASLDGSASSDAQGDILTYAWSFVSKPTGSLATLNDNQAVNPNFTTDVPGSYVISLFVSDAMLTSEEDRVQVTGSGAGLSFFEKEGSFGDTFNEVVFPYTNIGGAINIDAIGVPAPTSVTLNSFRLIAEGGDLTIIDVQVTNETNSLVPFFTTLTENLVLSDGVVVEFDLVTPLTGGDRIDLTYSFEIAETGQKFFVSYSVTSN